MTENMINEVTLAAMRKMYPGEIVRCVQVSRNFGRLGGWLRCEFLAQPDEDGNLNPTGYSASRVEYEFSV